MKRATVNYWVDVGIAIAFAVSAVSGLVFLLPAGADASILGIGFQVWDQLHLWSSLGMIAGVLAHLMLHSNWISYMTKRTLLPARSTQNGAVSAVGARRVTRRSFLSAVVATAVLGVATVTVTTLARGLPGYEVEDSEELGQPMGSVPAVEQDLTDTSDEPVETEVPAAADAGGTATVDAQAQQLPDTQDYLTQEVEEPVQQPQGVACPRGLVNDPYPGRCRRYTDCDGDGICDLSLPGSGSNAIRG